MDIALAVRELLAARTSPVFRPAELPPDLPLGSEGLDLDSIAVVEVLVECEDRFGIPAVDLLERVERPLTVGDVVAHFTG